jgi:hypothetical protein
VQTQRFRNTAFGVGRASDGFARTAQLTRALWFSTYVRKLRLQRTAAHFFSLSF